MRVCLMVVAVLLAGLMTGCSNQKLAPVKGTVKYKGQPLASGSITFHPEKGRPATGTIKNGEILDVTSFVSGDGAPVGPVKVTVQSIKGGGENMYAKQESLIPEKYGQVAKSGLTAEIKPEGGDVNINLD